VNKNIMAKKKGGEYQMGLKRKRSLRLVPLRIMVSAEHLAFINYRADTKNGSQGSVVRGLIDMELLSINRPERLHDEMSDSERNPSITNRRDTAERNKK